MKKQKLKENRIWIRWCIYGLLLLFLCIPLWAEGLYRISGGHDLNFHLMRIQGIAAGLKMGQFPVKIQPEWYNGYGYACSVFYGDLFLYVPALLRLLGLPLQGCYKVYVVLVQAATIGIADYAFRGIFKEEKAALAGTMLYSLSVYRLINIYVRGAVGEYTAMVFLPLLAYACVLLLRKDSTKQDRRKGVLLLAGGMTGIIQCHILSAEIACIFLALVCLLYLGRLFADHRIWGFVKAAVLALVVNLGFLIPFCDYMITGKFNVNAINGGWRVEPNIQEYGAFFTQMGQLLFHASGENLPVSMGIKEDMPMGVGLGLLLALLFALPVFWWNRKKKDRTDPVLYRLTGSLWLLSALAVWMSTCYFPWEALRKSNVLLRYLVINLQFPWRFCSVASLTLSMLWCCIFLQLGSKQLQLRQLRQNYVGIAAALAILLCTVSTGSLMYSVLEEGQAFRPAFAQAKDTMVASGEEYLPVNTISSQFQETNLHQDEGLQVEVLERKGIRLTLYCKNQTDTPKQVEMPLLYYKGYQAAGQPGNRKLAVTAGNNQVVSVTITGGFEGTVIVDFKEPWYWRMGELLALAGLLGTLITGILFARKGKSTGKEMCSGNKI